MYKYEITQTKGAIFFVFMLAPRKKLWSTPVEVIDKALELLSPKEEDVLFDIGAGDGRFLWYALPQVLRHDALA